MDFCDHASLDMSGAFSYSTSFMHNAGCCWAEVLAKGHVQRAHAMRCAPASGTLATFLRAALAAKTL